MDIIIANDSQAARLGGLYDLYQTAAIEEGYVRQLGEVGTAAMGARAWQDHIAAATIDIILTLGTADRLDGGKGRISMDVAARCVQEITGAAVIGALEVTPLYDKKARGFRPDVRHIGQIGGFAAASFARTYGIAQDCCAPILRQVKPL